MELFGIGPMELILVLFLAMLVFGPDRLPEMGARLGKGLRSMRRATREFSREMETTRQALDELKAPLNEVTAPIQELRNALPATSASEAVRQAVLREFKDASEGNSIAASETAELPTYRDILAQTAAEVAAEAPDTDDEAAAALELAGVVAPVAGETAAVAVAGGAQIFDYPAASRGGAMNFDCPEAPRGGAAIYDYPAEPISAEPISAAPVEPLPVEPAELTPPAVPSSDVESQE